MCADVLVHTKTINTFRRLLSYLVLFIAVIRDISQLKHFKALNLQAANAFPSIPVLSHAKLHNSRNRFATDKPQLPTFLFHSQALRTRSGGKVHLKMWTQKNFFFVICFICTNSSRPSFAGWGFQQRLIVYFVDVMFKSHVKNSADFKHCWNRYHAKHSARKLHFTISIAYSQHLWAASRALCKAHEYPLMSMRIA